MRLFHAFMLAATCLLTNAIATVALAVHIIGSAFAHDPRAYLALNRTPRSIFETRRMGLA